MGENAHARNPFSTDRSPPVRLPPLLLQQCWFLAGPTAGGKSAVALELAQLLGAEILALDSMTLYRGLDLGTAKPTIADRASVPHHLLDILDPDQEFSVAEYLHVARDCCEDILGRGRVPLFVGGTGLYLRSVLRGVFEGPPADAEFRRQKEGQALRSGPDSLHAELARIDAPSAARLHPNDLRRVIRALEVHHLTGRTLSEQHEQGPRPPGERPQHVYWLSPPREVLYQRIDQRVNAMFAAGWLAEAEQLAKREPPLGPTARKALGYQELFDWFDRGRLESLSTVIETIQTRTRQFSKRQLTWFRNLEECRSVEIRGDESPAAIAARLRDIAAG